MRCRYCLKEFHAEFSGSEVPFDVPPVYKFSNGDTYDLKISERSTTCPACRGGHIIHQQLLGSGSRLGEPYFVLPVTGKFSPAPPEVPKEIASDYTEANLVLPHSPKASAALARRCLQAVLTAAGYVSRNLAEQVQQAIDEPAAAKALPSSLRDSMDAIRNFGNFSAHPLTDVTTLQVIEVDEGEAEWCLELLLDLFDHYYVKPAKALERREALTKKLKAANKAPLKGKPPSP